MEIFKVIAVILAVFLHQGNGRASTSTSNDNIEVFSSDNMIQQKEASPVFKQKRSHVGPCYSGDYQTVELASGGLAAFPICRKLSLTGCASALYISQQLKRLCVASLTKVLIRRDDGTNEFREFAQSCSCAVPPVK